MVHVSSFYVVLFVDLTMSRCMSERLCVQPQTMLMPACVKGGELTFVICSTSTSTSRAAQHSAAPGCKWACDVYQVMHEDAERYKYIGHGSALVSGRAVCVRVHV